MSAGNFLSQIGLDPQLLTAGFAGGIVKSLIGRQNVYAAVASMIVGALMANFCGAPAAKLLSSIEIMGLKMEMSPALGGFFVGVFAYAIVDLVSRKVGDKLGGSAPK